MNRKEFIRSASLLTLTGMMELRSFGNTLLGGENSPKMPVLFIGHGNPMNALYDNAFTRMLNKTGKTLPKPRAILVVSAHWLTRGTYVADTTNPKTIYDFGGFPKELFEVKYPAKGSPEFAEEVKKEVKSVNILSDHEMGFDHGAWTILKHLYPGADIPTFQLSIDYGKPASYHYALAKELLALRSKGLLIVGSGNIVHNLGMLNWNDPNPKPFDWSLEFDEKVKLYLNNHNHEGLISYEKMGKAAQLSVPTNDHYLPMIYTLGLQQKNEHISYLYEGIEMGSISMRCFLIS